MIFNHNVTRSKKIFFRSGDQRKYMTGGWRTVEGGTGNVTPESEIGETIYLKGVSKCWTGSSLNQNSWKSVRAETAKTIDVTNLTEVYFNITSRYILANNVVTGYLRVGVGSAYTEVTKTGIVTVDVSELTGKQQIYAEARGGYYTNTSSLTNPYGNYEPHMRISKIWAK